MTLPPSAWRCPAQARAFTFNGSVCCMTAQDNGYAAKSREFIAQAVEELEKGDLVQASEKLWGAAAQMVKSVATRRGWEHGGHRQLFQVVNRLAQESEDPELRQLFQLANSFHSNFYENWMTREFVEQGVSQVQALVDALGSA